MSLETPGGRNAWFEAKDRTGDIDDYLTDLDTALSSADERGDTVGQLRYASCAAAIRSLSRGVTPELLAALVARGVWSPEQALTYVRQQLHAAGLEPAERGSVAHAVEAVAPQLDAALVPAAVELVREIYDDAPLRAQALSGLARRLADVGEPTAAWALVLEVVESTYDPEEFAPLGAYVSARVAPEVVLQAVDPIARLRTGYKGRTDGVAPLLAALAPSVPEAERGAVAERALVEARMHSPSQVAQVALVFPDDDRRREVMLEALRRALELRRDPDCPHRWLRIARRRRRLIALSARAELFLDALAEALRRAREAEQAKSERPPAAGLRMARSLRQIGLGAVLGAVLEVMSRPREVNGRADGPAAVAPLAAQIGLHEQALYAAWRAFDAALKDGFYIRNDFPNAWRWNGTALFEVAEVLPAEQRKAVHARAHRQASRAGPWQLAMIANALESPLRERAAERACRKAAHYRNKDLAARTIIIALPALPAPSRGDALIDAARLNIGELTGEGHSTPAGVDRDAWTRPWGLADHAIGSVPSADRPGVLQRLAAQLRERQPDDRARGFALLVRYSEGAQALDFYDEAVADVRTLAEDSKSAALARLSPMISCLTRDKVESLLETHTRIDDGPELAATMAAYAPAHGPAWDQALMQVRAIQNPELRAPALAELAALAHDADLLAEALDAAPSSRDFATSRFDKLFVRVCAREDWDGALTVARMHTVLDDQRLFRPTGGKLTAIARAAPTDLAPRIAEAARSTGSEREVVRTLLALSERLEGHHARDMRLQALSVALIASDREPDEYVLRIAVGAMGAAKHDLTKRKFDAIARDILAATSMLTSGSTVGVLVEIAPYLPERLLGQAAEIARRLKGDDATAALAALAAGCQSPVRAEMFAEAWQLALALPPKEKRDALCALAGKLPQDYGEPLVTAVLALDGGSLAWAVSHGVAAAAPERCMAQLLGAVRGVTDGDNAQAEALAAIAKRLARLGLSEEALEAVTGLSMSVNYGDDSAQHVASRDLPCVFAELGQPEMAARALDLVPSNIRDGIRVRVATLLAGHDAHAALRAAMEIAAGRFRGSALEAIAPELAALPRDECHAALTDAVGSFARGTRAELMIALRSLRPVVIALAPDADEEITLAIGDVARWWP